MRASAMPPASAIQNCIDGAARAARNDTVATWARPVGVDGGGSGTGTNIDCPVLGLKPE